MFKKILLIIVIAIVSFIGGAWYVINNQMPIQILLTGEKSMLISISVFGQAWDYYTEDCEIVSTCN